MINIVKDTSQQSTVVPSTVSRKQQKEENNNNNFKKSTDFINQNLCSAFFMDCKMTIKIQAPDKARFRLLFQISEQLLIISVGKKKQNPTYSLHNYFLHTMSPEFYRKNTPIF